VQPAIFIFILWTSSQRYALAFRAFVERWFNILRLTVSAVLDSPGSSDIDSLRHRLS